MLIRLLAGMVLGAIAGLFATRALRMRVQPQLVVTRPIGAMIIGAIVGMLFASPLMKFTPSAHVEQMDSIQQLQSTIAQNPVVLVDFYADWCGPCRAMKAVIHKLANHYEGRIKIVTVNIDDHEDISRTWHVKAIPDIRVYKNGELAKLNQGYRSFSSYREELDLLLGE